MSDVWGTQKKHADATRADLERAGLWTIEVDTVLDDGGMHALAWGTPPGGGGRLLWLLHPDADVLGYSDAAGVGGAPHEQLGPLPAVWVARVAAAGTYTFQRKYELRLAVLTDTGGRGVRHPACTGDDDGWPCSVHDEHIEGAGVRLSMCRHKWGYQCRWSTPRGLCPASVPAPGRRCSTCAAS